MSNKNSSHSTAQTQDNRTVTSSKPERKPPNRFWQTLERGVGQLKFSTLIALTFITVALLTPFALSPLYLPLLRNNAFDLHQVLKGELYKQITGYTSLVLIVFEMVLIARKRGRGWKVKLTIPGSIKLWRNLHILVGIALVGTTLLHTIGATGVNFNAVFLWVFFGTTLSALVGVVAETGVLESPRKYFSWSLGQEGMGKPYPGISKGLLIINLRSIWLTTHIILVSIFSVMLVFHIFLAYYYQ